MRPKIIAIIGGGASGALTALQLLRQASNKHSALKIVLFDPRPLDQLGKGLAYSATDERHLLNVPAGNMSALAEQADHFYQWLQKKEASATPLTFAPRKWYGDYLQQSLQEAIRLYTNEHRQWEHWQSAVVAAHPEGEGWRLYTEDQRMLDADACILAIGNAAPADIPLAENAYTSHPHYRRDPWAKSDTEIADDAAIFFIGTGLTAVDEWISLHGREHQGKLLALSPQGYLPRTHLPGTAPYPTFGEALLRARTPLAIFRLVRRHLERAARLSIAWQAVIDSIRPFIQRIWAQWTIEERKTFLRHINPIWAVIRHRMAGQIAAKVDELQAQGRLDIVAGRILSIQPHDTGFEIRYRLRASGEEKRFYADYIINCTGPQSNVHQLDMPLMQDLLQQGLIAADPLRLGLEGDTETMQLRKADGALCPHFYFVGPCTKSIYWESVAMPEIRVQASRLAGILLMGSLDAEG